MSLIYEGSTINKKNYRHLPQDEHDAFVETIFQYYREHGFPFIDLSFEERVAKFQKLKDYTTDLISNRVIIQRMEGLGLAWHYFPHIWEIPITGVPRTPMDVFRDDTLFRKAIIKRLRFGDNISDNGIRKALMVYGTQRVSNFRPTAAKAIYHRYLEGTTNIVWDMSCGFGGRLLGALACGKVKHYTGTDPSQDTQTGLQKIVADFGDESRVSLYQRGSEDHPTYKNSLDLCFTSPPYFNTEKYSEELTQSYKKFETSSLWLNGFLRLTFRNCYYGLKINRFMIINVANVKTLPTLEQDTVKIAQEEGFTLHETLQLMLSKIPSVHGEEKITHKFEPVFVFKK